MLKPQAIKDQEFQIKFRGYDPIEVRNYLELLAEDFFELSERNRALKEQLDTLEFNAPSVPMDMDMSLSTLESLEGVEDVQLEIEEEDRKRLEVQRELEAKLAHAESRLDTLATENMGYLSQVGDLNKQLEEIESEASRKRKEQKDLKSEIERLTKENSELKSIGKDAIKDSSETSSLQAEIDRLTKENLTLKEEEAGFKKAVLAAQAFADKLRKDAEIDASKIVDEAKSSADRFAIEAEELKKAAELDAEGIVGDAKSNADRLVKEADELKRVAGVDAEKIVDDAKSNADHLAKEADELKKAAETEATRIVDDAKANADRFAKEADELKKSAENEATGIVDGAKSRADQLYKEAEEIKSAAGVEAVQIVEDAKQRAEQYANDLRNQVADLPRQIEELQGRKELARNDLRGVLNGYLSKLDMDEQ